jgi:glycolate oxidase iron-sulfur subunit
MQHGLGQTGRVEDILERAGFTLARQPAAVLCCGSAGSYSLLQPRISERLRDDALANLCAEAPAVIASANIGCQLHLASGTSIPVIHWIELLDS